MMIFSGMYYTCRFVYLSKNLDACDSLKGQQQEGRKGQTLAFGGLLQMSDHRRKAQVTLPVRGNDPQTHQAIHEIIQQTVADWVSSFKVQSVIFGSSLKVPSVIFSWSLNMQILMFCYSLKMQSVIFGSSLNVQSLIYYSSLNMQHVIQ